MLANYQLEPLDELKTTNCPKTIAFSAEKRLSPGNICKLPRDVVLFMVHQIRDVLMMFIDKMRRLHTGSNGPLTVSTMITLALLLQKLITLARFQTQFSGSNSTCNMHSGVDKAILVQKHVIIRC